MHVYLIGDQTADIFDDFQRLLHDHGDFVVQSFLNQVYFYLRGEVTKVHNVQPGAIPKFSSLADLLLARREGPLHASLDQALVCAFQIATFMRFVDFRLLVLLCLKDGYLTNLAADAANLVDYILNPTIPSSSGYVLELYQPPPSVRQGP